jgi:hypothetical protein
LQLISAGGELLAPLGPFAAILIDEVAQVMRGRLQRANRARTQRSRVSDTENWLLSIV